MRYKSLLNNIKTNVPLPVATYSPFNVTEARLRQLIYPSQPFNWQRHCFGWLVNLSIIALLSSSIIFLNQSNIPNTEVSRCVVEPGPVLETQLSSLQ